MMELVELLLEVSHLAVEYHNHLTACLITQGTHLFRILASSLQNAVSFLQQEAFTWTVLGLNLGRSVTKAETYKQYVLASLSL
jgi:hypothetical protein